MTPIVWKIVFHIETVSGEYKPHVMLCGRKSTTNRWRLDKDVAVKLRQQPRNTTTNPPPESRAAVPVPCPKDSALLLLRLQIHTVAPEHRGHPFGHPVLSRPCPIIDPSKQLNKHHHAVWHIRYSYAPH